MSNTPNLSRLERGHVRDIWPDEARDFTPWLAEPENIGLLGEVIGMDLEVEGQEQSVGPFKADILCKDADSNDDHFVLIENQLERTNHGHLGQLLTYAAGLNAVTIVWIADRFTDEHRAALDWLNDITSDEFRFFGLEIEVWRIGESSAAPKFNVISKPNDWTAGVSNAARRVTDKELTETKLLQMEYWTAFWDLAQSERSFLQGTKPRPQHWNNFAVGRSKFGMDAAVNTQKQWIQVGLSCRGPDAFAHFELLRNEREQIEEEIGSKLEWRPLPHRKVCRIVLRNADADPTIREDWPRQHAWLKQTLEAFDHAFRKRVATLDSADYAPEDDG